jgi:hypothetical protein
MISGSPKSPAMGRAESPACLLESHTGKEQSQMFNKLQDELGKLHIPESFVFADCFLIFF